MKNRFTYNYKDISENMRNIVDNYSDRIINIIYEISSRSDIKEEIRESAINYFKNLHEEIIKFKVGDADNCELYWEDVYWMGGVFSAAGSFSVDGKKKIPRVSLNSYDERSINKIAELLDLKVIKIKHGEKISYKVAASGKHALYIMNMLSEVVTGKNKDKAEYILHDTSLNDVKMVIKSWVYFVRAEIGGPIKIGVTSDLVTRFHALQANSPVKLKLLFAFIGGFPEELELHTRLKYKKSHGEWYDLSDEEIEELIYIEANRELFPGINRFCIYDINDSE